MRFVAIKRVIGAIEGKSLTNFVFQRSRLRSISAFVLSSLYEVGICWLVQRLETKCLCIQPLARLLRSILWAFQAIVSIPDWPSGFRSPYNPQFRAVCKKAPKALRWFAIFSVSGFWLASRFSNIHPSISGSIATC